MRRFYTLGRLDGESYSRSAMDDQLFGLDDCGTVSASSSPKRPIMSERAVYNVKLLVLISRYAGT